MLNSESFFYFFIFLFLKFSILNKIFKGAKKQLKKSSLFFQARKLKERNIPLIT
jgi:hypothetical protein